MSRNGTETERYDVFLSHSHVDADIVEELAKFLEDRFDFKVWLDKWVLIPGKSWQQAIIRGLKEVECCAVCMGEKTSKGWFREEIELALNRQTRDETFRVIPILLPKSNSHNIDEFLQLRTRVDFRKGLNDEGQLYNLSCGIKGIAPGRGPDTNNANKGQEEATQRKLQWLREWKVTELIDASVAVEYQRKALDDWMKES